MVVIGVMVNPYLLVFVWSRNQGARQILGKRGSAQPMREFQEESIARREKEELRGAVVYGTIL